MILNKTVLKLNAAFLVLISSLQVMNTITAQTQPLALRNYSATLKKNEMYISRIFCQILMTFYMTSSTSRYELVAYMM